MRPIRDLGSFPQRNARIVENSIDPELSTILRELSTKFSTVRNRGGRTTYPTFPHFHSLYYY